MARDIRWILRSRTFRYEFYKLVGLLVTFGASVWHLSQLMFPLVWRPPHRGPTYQLVFGMIDTFGWNSDAFFVFFAGIYLGLVGLVMLDEYKRHIGYILFVVTVVGGYILWLNDTFVPHLDWVVNWGFLVAGALVGVLVGGVYWSGLVPRRSTVHHVFLTPRSTGRREFPGAIPSMLVMAGLVFVLAFYEVHHVSLDTAPGNSLALLLFCGSLYAVRRYTKDQTAVVIGPSGSGKSSLLAGMAYTLEDVDTNTPLGTLQSELQDGGFSEFIGTPTDYAVPLRLSYRHGWLFPKKVDVRVIDYAGEHVQTLDVHRDRSEVKASSAEEVFEVAKNVCSTAETAGSVDDDISFYDDEVGKPPDMYDSAGPALARELVSDLLFYADSIGLLLPLDLYLDEVDDPAADLPSYVDFDGDGNPRPITERADVTDDVVGKYNTISERCSGSVFHAFTMSDLAISTYRPENPDPSNEIRNMDAFRDHVVHTFLPADVAPRLPHLFPGRKKYDEGDAEGHARFEDNVDTLSYDRDNAIPVYFPVEEDEGTGQPELINVDIPILEGADELSERMGRMGRFQG